MSSIRQKPDPFGLNELEPFWFNETQPAQKGPDLQPPPIYAVQEQENTNQTHEVTWPPAPTTTTAMNNHNHHDPYDDE